MLTHPSIRITEDAFSILKLPWPHAVGLIRRVNIRDSEQNLRISDSGIPVCFLQFLLTNAALLGVSNPAKCDRSIVINTFGNWKVKNG